MDLLLILLAVLGTIAAFTLIAYVAGVTVVCQDFYQVQSVTGLVKLYTEDRAMFLKPTKTATRALERSFRECGCADKPIFPWGHHLNPSNLSVPAREYYVVMRHPYERALSGFSFRKQGGENGDEEGTEAVKFVRQYETLEDLVTANPDIESLPLLEPQHQYMSYFKQNVNTPRPIIPICYPNLSEEWPKLAKKFGCNECTLQVANRSNSRKYTLGPNTKKYIDEHLAGDIELYETYCGQTANVTYT